MPTRYCCLRPSELTSSQLDCWDAMTASSHNLDSPYLRPEFTLAVAHVRDDVRIVIAGDPAAPDAFWPFQLGRSGRGIPVGGPVNDRHGVIANDRFSGSARDLLGCAGLKRWVFHQLAPSQSAFHSPHNRTEAAPYISLANGYADYSQLQQAAHRRTFKDLRKRALRIADAWGELDLQWHTDAPEMLERLIAWKQQQYERTSVFNVFSVCWTKALVRHLHKQQSARFAGVLSVLSAGDRIAAMHLGLRSASVLHCWYPAYNRQAAPWSPGLQAFQHLARRAPDHGILRLDLGKGPEGFKTKIANGAHQISSGVAGESVGGRHVRVQLERTTRWLRRSPLRTPIKQLLSKVHPGRGKSSFQ